MTLPADIMLPNDKERRQIFYWLQRISSYTAWNRVLGYYRQWAQVAEAAVRLASEQGTKPEAIKSQENELIQILRGLAHHEEGVRRLGLGDKRVFKYDTEGEFVMAGRVPSHWSQQLRLYEEGDAAISFSSSPLWGRFVSAMRQYFAAHRECGPEILESRFLESAAPMFYGKWMKEALPKKTFPNSLPDVPEPREVVLVPTGKEIPYSGIWEPIDAPVKKGFTLFRSEEAASGNFALAGCMNYLHGGSPAPKACVQTSHESSQLDVTWRLLWHDERYQDKAVPVEENSYVFESPS